MAAINNDWLDALKGEFSKPYYKKLFETVNQEYRTHRVYPPADDIFNAFHLTPLKDVKVVILGFSCSLITTFPGSSIKIVFIFSSSVICCILCCIICCIQHSIRNILCQDIFILSLFFVYYAQIPLWVFINNNNKLSPFYFMYL